MKFHKNRFFSLLLSIAIVGVSVSALPVNVRAADEYLVAANDFFNSTYTEGETLSREEFCARLAEAFLADYDASLVLPFEDTASIAPKNVFYISALVDSGVLAGVSEDGKLYMHPSDNIKREEAFALIAKLFSLTSDYKLLYNDAASVSPYAVSAAAWLTENNFLPNEVASGRLDPKATLDTDTFAEILIKMLDYQNAERGRVISYAGTGAQGADDGRSADSAFTLPYGIAADKSGAIVVADTYNNKLRRVSIAGTENITGKTAAKGDDGFAEGETKDAQLPQALLNRPYGIAVDSTGRYIFSDSAGNRIRFADEDGVDTLTGSAAGFKDGATAEALFNYPTAIAVDANDVVYVADTLNHCIRKIENGQVSTLAGVPEAQGFADGSAAEALFLEPTGIAVTEDGSVVYVADTGNQLIRKIQDGKVVTIAGVITEKDEDGYAFGGFKDGHTEAALFNQPSGLTLVGDTLLVADSGNNRIRAIWDGEVVTVAGNGEAGDRDGAALFAELNHPRAVCYSNGYIYIADTTNNKIRRMPYGG